MGKLLNIVTPLHKKSKRDCVKRMNDNKIECMKIAKKYEKEGGPSLQDCVKLIKDQCTVPAVEIDKVIRWAFFNWLCHNADAHGKNISFLFTPDGKTTVAPFYDLVCTRNYKQIGRELAMKIGGQSDPGEMALNRLESFAEEIEVSTRLVKDIALESATRLIDNFEPVSNHQSGRGYS